jgi:magnesium transporter
VQPRPSGDDAPPSRRHDIAHEHEGIGPGHLHIHREDKPQIFLVDYAEDWVEERELGAIDECVPYLDADSVTWIDVRGIRHKPTFERLGAIFGIHPLALEDMVNVPQRPKSDLYEGRQLLVTRMVTLVDGELQSEQMSILFGKGFVVTVQEEPAHDCLDPLRARIRAARGGIRKAGSDYLAYAIFDTVIDGFYPVLEHYGEVLDDLELRALSKAGVPSSEIFDIKRQLLQLRRAIWPQRDLVSSLLREASPLISSDTRVYIRDTYDHAVQVMDMVETFREIASSLMDLHMTGVSNRLNETMKVLTVVSTIFLPMTFIAGIYGMNFDPKVSPLNMPELEWYWGYPFSFLLMLLSVASLLIYYRSRGLIGKKGDAYSKARTALRRVRR